MFSTIFCAFQLLSVSNLSGLLAHFWSDQNLCQSRYRHVAIGGYGDRCGFAPSRMF